MPIVDAYSQRKFLDVMEDTWSHLAPKPSTDYKGYVVFALGVYGHVVVLQWDFKSDTDEDLEGSPWFFEDLSAFVGDKIDASKCENGTIFKFTGTYRKRKSRGRYTEILNCQFRGVLSKRLIDKNFQVL
jgi:hypothetical protein